MEKKRIRFAWRRARATLFEACAIFVAGFLLFAATYFACHFVESGFLIVAMIGFAFFGAIFSLAWLLMFIWRFFKFFRKYPKYLK